LKPSLIFQNLHTGSRESRSAEVAVSDRWKDVSCGELLRHLEVQQQNACLFAVGLAATPAAAAE
jgi:hypothetical protein